MCVCVCVHDACMCCVYTGRASDSQSWCPAHLAKACVIMLHIAQPFPGIPKYGVLHLKYCQSIQHNTIIRSCSFCRKVLGMDVWSIAQYSQIK